MDAIKSRDRAKILACMKEMYCSMESATSIPPTKLNHNEGRYGAQSRLVKAFKSFQGRVYGVEGSVHGKRAFFASLAVVKKSNKADQELLKRAVDRLSSVSEVKGAEV